VHMCAVMVRCVLCTAAAKSAGCATRTSSAAGVRSLLLACAHGCCDHLETEQQSTVLCWCCMFHHISDVIAVVCSLPVYASSVRFVLRLCLIRCMISG
jgi:hypothetical protein